MDISPDIEQRPHLEDCWRLETVLQNWSNLSSSDTRLLEGRFFGKTMSMIADEESLTRQAVSAREEKAIAKLELEEPCVQELLDSFFSVSKFVCLRDLLRFNLLPNGLKYSLLKFGDLEMISYETGAVVAPRNLSASEYFRREMPMSVQEMEGLAWPIQHQEARSYLEDCMRGVFIEGLGIVRKSAHKRDEAVLHLRNSGAPIVLDKLCSLVNLDTRNLKAQLDRDPRFVRNFATEEVKLREWIDKTPPVKNATEAVIRVLETEGPQSRADLVNKAVMLFPRNKSRYYQVLARKEFGLTSDEKIDLVSRGARAASPREPEPSDQVREYSSSKLAFNVKVGADLLRGAGVVIPRRAAWIVGTRRPGDSQPLSLSSGERLDVTCYPGSSALPSLRKFANKLTLEIGCELEVVIDVEAQLIGIRGACECHFNQRV